MAKEWLLISEGQYFADLHLSFVPLENQHAIGGQHAKALGKALGQVVAPVIGEKSILGAQPAISPGTGEVWRVEDDHLECAVIKGEAAKVHDDVGLYVQDAAIAEHVLLIANVTEQGALVALVEPEHAATAAGVKDFSGGGHGHPSVPTR